MNLDLMKDGIEGREIPYPIAFNEYGAADFNTWLRRHWRHEVKPNTGGLRFVTQCIGTFGRNVNNGLLEKNGTE